MSNRKSSKENQFTAQFVHEQGELGSMHCKFFFLVSIPRYFKNVGDALLT